MVRIGIGLYGFGNDDYETSQLKNTHNLSSIISQIHEIEAGNSVGYNRAFKATKKHVLLQFQLVMLMEFREP